MLEFLKEKNGQCNQTGQSEVQIKVLPQCISRITEETGVSIFSHKYTLRMNMNSLQLLETKEQSNSSYSALTTYGFPVTQQRLRAGVGSSAFSC